MKTKEELLREVREDIKLDVPYVPGVIKKVDKCWHVSTDGAFADVLFEDRDDFVRAVNAIAKCYLVFGVLIFAFCLMDNHVHFVLYGEKAEVVAFIREFLRRVSHSISTRHGRRSVVASIPLSVEAITDEEYLKNAICYDINNPPVGGVKCSYFDYPWSSGALYFRNDSSWASPAWFGDKLKTFKELPYAVTSVLDRSGKLIPRDWHMAGDMVFPGDFVCVKLVESLFRSHRAFCFLCGRRNEKEMEKNDSYSAMFMQDSELRQLRNELLGEMFGCRRIHTLSIPERIRLARRLRKKYACSLKQAARMVCLPHGTLEKALGIK